MMKAKAEAEKRRSKAMKYLAGYIAVCEFRINLKSITTDFISNLVLLS
jgi:hypothetical protein